MNRSTIIPAERARPSSRRFGPLDRAARIAVHAALSRIAHGGLTVDEDGEVRRHGPEADGPRLEVLDSRFWRAVVSGGSLGAAEAYIRGWWRSDDLTQLLRVFVRNMELADGLERGPARLFAPLARLGHWIRRNTRSGSRENIRAHYDLGNDLFSLFLDGTMTYSCALFETPETTLREGQVAKLDRICRKLELQSGDRVLEIGTGWGSFAIHAASHYGVHVTTTTISRDQHELATRRVREAGLEDKISILLTDYRDLEGRFDKLVSIEMIEAVGHEFLETYFAKCSELLEPNGRMVIQAITMADHRYERYRKSVDFIKKYVFPGCCVPSFSAMSSAVARGTDLRISHVEDIGRHYARTLREWRERFFEQQEAVRELGYPEEFVRLWDYYLSYCEAGFAERYLGDVHMVLEKPGALLAALGDARARSG